MICARSTKRKRANPQFVRAARRLLLLGLIAFASYADAAMDQHDSRGKKSCSRIENQLRSARRLIDGHELNEGERLLLALQESHPDCGEVLSTLAGLRASQGDEQTAEQMFVRAVELSPDNPRSYLDFASFSFTQENYGRADYLTDRALSLDSEDADALVLKGQIQTMKGDMDAARDDLEKACKLAPSNPEAHFQMAVFFDGKKLHQAAVREFERAIALRPADPRAYDYLGLNLEALGKTKQAETAYREGLARNRGRLFDYFLDYNYGRFLIKEQRLTESKVHLDRALSLAPDTRAVYYEHGKLNFLLGRYQEARLDEERALGLSDPSGFVLDLQVDYLLAKIYSRLGEQELAYKYAELSRTAKVPIQDRARN